MAKEYEENREGVELMKTQEEIYQKIRELENDTNLLKKYDEKFY